MIKTTFNSFVMNKLQNPKMNNTIDFTDKKIGPKVAKDAVSLM
jgi:hypothetical protein